MASIPNVQFPANLTYLRSLHTRPNAAPVTQTEAPPTPGEQVQLSPQIASAPEVVTTRSGVHTEVTRGAFGTALKAALPAGGLLPAPLIIESIQGPNGTTHSAYVQKGDEKVAVPVATTSDGRFAVTMDPGNANAPLLMFDPQSMDFGLLSPLKSDGAGGHTRTLQEFNHADGSKTIVQDERTSATGQKSYNQVFQDASGNVRGGQVVADAQGGRQWTEMPAKIGENAVSIGKQEAPQKKGVKDFYLDSWRKHLPFMSKQIDALDKKLGKTEAARDISFRTFSQAMSHSPGMVFPGLMQALAPTELATASTGAARVFRGDITKLPAEAILTGINSGGPMFWNGGLDRTIRTAASGQYHSQLAQRGSLQDGQMVVANKTAAHDGAFDKVLFMVDDHKQPLGDMLYKGLKKADEEGLTSVNLPAFRTGAAAGRMETEDQVVAAMAGAIKKFRAEGGKNLKDINVVVYRDNELADKFEDALK